MKKTGKTKGVILCMFIVSAVFIVVGNVYANGPSAINVALNAEVTLHGGSFFTGGWGGGLVVSEDTIVDGVFFPRHQQWDQGPVWWDCTDDVDRYITIDLGEVYIIESFIVQADDNDAYLLYYWDIITSSWELAWHVPNYDEYPDPSSWGMQTRPDPDDDTERYLLPQNVITDALMFMGDMDDGDRCFSVSEIQAYGVLKVSVDVKPGSWPNPIQKGSKGVTSVAICGTEDFDVMTVDPVTVKLYIEGIEDGVPPLRWSWEDVATPYDDTTPDEPDGHEEKADGYIDLVLKYDTPEVVETLGLCEFEDWEYVRLFIRGNLFEAEGGIPIEGFDWIRIQSQEREILPSFLKGTRISVYEEEYTLPVGEWYFVSHGFLKDGWKELSVEERKTYIEDHWFELYIDGVPVELKEWQTYYKKVGGYEDAMLLMFYIQYKPYSFEPGSYEFRGEWHLAGELPFVQTVTVNFIE